MKLFINSKLHDINPYESIYSIKHNLNNFQTLYHNGFILDDHKCLKYYNITENSSLYFSNGLKGGFDVFYIIVWFIYIICILLYFLILISGLLPVIAHVYDYILLWTIRKFGSLLGIDNNNIFKLFTWSFSFVLRIFIVYFFVYAFTSFAMLFLFYNYYGDVCKTMKTSNLLGYIVSITFIIIYGIFNIPDELLLLFNEGMKINTFAATFGQPLGGLLQQIADVGKWTPIYAIPIVGTPILTSYHFAVSTIATALYDSTSYMQLFNCDNKQVMEKMGKMFECYDKFPPLKDLAKSYHLENFFKMVAIGLIPKKKEYYKCLAEKQPFWEKLILWGNAGKYYTATSAVSVLCTVLAIIKGFNTMLSNEIGGSLQLANMIKTGSLAGIGGVIALLISIILVFFGIIQ